MELNEKQYLQSLVHVIRAKQRAGGWSDTKELADYIIKEIGGLSQITDADELEAMERFLKSVIKGDTSKEFPRAVTDPDHPYYMAASPYEDFEEQIILAAARAVQVSPDKVFKDFTQNDDSEIRKAVQVLHKRACAVTGKSMFN